MKTRDGKLFPRSRRDWRRLSPEQSRATHIDAHHRWIRKRVRDLFPGASAISVWEPEGDETIHLYVHGRHYEYAICSNEWFLTFRNVDDARDYLTIPATPQSEGVDHERS